MNKYLSITFLFVCYFVFSNNCFGQIEIEKAIFAELNIARTNPKVYIDYLEEHKKLFIGKRVNYPEYMMETFEGTKAVDEAISYLKNLPKLGPLSFSDALSKPASIQLTDLLENPSLGHRGKDGSNLPKRLSRFGIKPLSHFAENILQDVTLPRRIVLLTIIDDGVRDRGHRKNLFDKRFNQVGIAYGLRKNMGTSVLVFAGETTEIKK